MEQQLYLFFNELRRSPQSKNTKYYSFHSLNFYYPLPISVLLRRTSRSEFHSQRQWGPGQKRRETSHDTHRCSDCGRVAHQRKSRRIPFDDGAGTRRLSDDGVVRSHLDHASGAPALPPPGAPQASADPVPPGSADARGQRAFGPIPAESKSPS